jgi:hypothetical protein
MFSWRYQCAAEKTWSFLVVDSFYVAMPLVHILGWIVYTGLTMNDVFVCCTSLVVAE